MTGRSERRSSRGRFVHLGERLVFIERIRAGLMTCAEAAGELAVDEREVRRWLELHRDDRLVSIDELRESQGARLAARARRLAILLAAAERRVRELHLELISKEFGANPHRDSEDVVRAQRQRE